MSRIIFLVLILFSAINAEETLGSFVKEKKEIIALKKDLNKFYTQKEKEYQKRKKELDSLLQKVKNEKAEIQRIYERNQGVLKDIKGEVVSKTSKIYNTMKPKIAASIFDSMIEEGKIEDVFDIILKIKEKKVTLIMKFLSVKNASIITEKLKNYQVDDGKEG